MNAKALVGLVVALLVASCSSGTQTDVNEPGPQLSTTTIPSQPASEPEHDTRPGDATAELDPLDLYDVSDLVKQVRNGVVSVTQERV